MTFATIHARLDYDYSQRRRLASVAALSSAGPMELSNVSTGVFYAPGFRRDCTPFRSNRVNFHALWCSRLADDRGYYDRWDMEVLKNAVQDGSGPSRELDHRYVTVVNTYEAPWGGTSTSHSMVGGFPTLAGAIPTSGSRDYHIEFRPSFEDSFPTGAGYLSVNFADRSVILVTYFAAMVSGELVLHRIVVWRGAIAPGTGNFTGSADRDPPQTSGTFHGTLFGPNAEELGVVFSYAGDSTLGRDDVIGYALGKQK